MRVALVGPPQSGKSTLFSAVTETAVDLYAAPTVRHAVVHVPEPRLEFLVKLDNPKKVTEAAIEFVDVPGCSLDDAKGREEWRHFLPEVRQADLLALVIRDFANEAVPAYRGRIDPQADLDVVWEEFLFADLDTASTRIERLEKSLKKPTKTHDAEKRELELLTRCRAALEAEEPLSSVSMSDEQRRQLASFAFLTQKPAVAIRNVSDDRASSAEALMARHAVDSVVLSASIEAEIAALPPVDRESFLQDFGLQGSTRGRLIRTCYRACGLISFFTTGPDEVRAWTIPHGATAQEAAGVIHTDFARGFIRAETVGYDELVACHDFRGAKAAGKVRKEGKGYVVQDGDVLHILAST